MTAIKAPILAAWARITSILVTPLLHQQILTQVIEPTLKGMAQDGIPFKGFLYAGLMITPIKKFACWNIIVALAIRKHNPY